MKWAAIMDGLRAWIAQVLGIPEGQVWWEAEPLLQRDFPQVDLALRDLHTLHTDEQRDVSAEDDENMKVVAVGNRTFRLEVRVRSRDHNPDARAMSLLDRVLTSLELPSAEAAFCAAGVAVAATFPIVDFGTTLDNRQMSEAMLELQMNATAESTFGGETEPEQVGTIEHVEVGGTAHEGDNTITVPETVVPPLEES